MNFFFITLNMLVNVYCIAQIYPQEKTDTSVATTLRPDMQNSKMSEKPFICGFEPMPQFPGGDAELMKFIKENLKSPKSMSDNCIQGQVIVRFVVSTDGSIKNVQVLRSLEAACDKEAVRVVESMPKWVPGKQNGKPVDVYYTLPVRFRLKENAGESIIKEMQ